MRKILYIFSLIISILLNVSADVYRLKVKGVLAEKDNFWVKDGEPSDTQTDDGMHFVSTTKAGEETPLLNSNKIYFKKTPLNSDTNGDVVIYLKGIESQDDRRAAAKRQFENILKCGLLNEDKKAFNETIFAQQFSQGFWEMPGISARISNDKSESYVLCSLKRKKGKQVKTDDFIAKNMWKNLDQVTEIGSFEHTERQLMFSMLYGGIQLKKTEKSGLRSEPNDFFIQKETATTLAKPTNGDLFFIWTRGNPCISIDGLVDNGGYCCAVWYKEEIKTIINGANMYLYYGEKSGAYKDIQVRLCGRDDETEIYPNNDNFGSISAIVDVFFVDSNCHDTNFRNLLNNFKTNANNDGIRVVYTHGNNSVFFSKTVMDANRLCCLISGQSSFGYINSSADPIAILNSWMGIDSSIEYQTW